MISIHALREEGDAAPHGRSSAWRPISIHALREEGDYSAGSTLLSTVGFLSTPSARRATTSIANMAAPTDISIHALREEGDCAAV